MLAPGSILFVGWDSDNNDITFITTTDLAAGDVIYFTDDERDANGFFGGEQLMEWTVPAGGVGAGTVVNIDMDNSANTVSFDSGGAVDYIRGGYSIAGGNEMFWAFQGTRVGDTVTPTNYIAVIGNEADGTDTQTPNLTGTGLTFSNGAFVIDGDEDYMEWVGDTALSNPVQQADLIASILDTNNWVTADGAGNNNPNGTFFDVNFQNVVCFTSGTLIETVSGPRRVECLVPGDRVVTRAGQAALRWIGRRVVSSAELAKAPGLRPVRISSGALGQGLPRRDLRVSRQHRILVRSRLARQMFGAPEVLIPAFRLVGLPGVQLDDAQGGVEYVHLLFDDHEVIYAEGAPTESLFTGPQALKAVLPEQREEILAIFPELAELDHAALTAAPVPPAKRLRRFVERSAREDRMLIDR